MKMNKTIRTIAFFTALIFSFTTVVHSAPSSVYKINVPESIGTVKERWRGNEKNGVVVHVQDAHTSLEAQVNLAKILLHLEKNEKVKHVGLEGGDRVLDVSSCRDFAIPQARNAMVHRFMQQGVLSGVESAAILGTGRAQYAGIEETELFYKNLEQFNEATNSFEKNADAFRQLQKTIDDYYHEVIIAPALAAFLEKEKQYKNNAIPLFDFIEVLLTGVPTFDDLMQNCPVLYSFIETVQKKRTFFKDVLDLEKKALRKWAHERQGSFSEEDQNTYHTIAASLLSTSEDGYEQLLSLHQKYGIIEARNGARSRMPYEYLRKYLTVCRSLEAIDFPTLFREIEHVSMDIKLNYARSDEERAYILLDEGIRFIENLITLKLVPEDTVLLEEKTETIRTHIYEFARAQSIIIDYRHLNALIDKAICFYREAHRRDEVLVNNHLANVQDNKNAVSVLVSGGFHSPGIKQALKKRGISYVEIAPRMTDIRSDIPYVEKMRGSLVSPHSMSQITIHYLLSDLSRGKGRRTIEGEVKERIKEELLSIAILLKLQEEKDRIVGKTFERGAEISDILREFSKQIDREREKIEMSSGDLNKIIGKLHSIMMLAGADPEENFVEQLPTGDEALTAVIKKAYTDSRLEWENAAPFITALNRDMKIRLATLIERTRVFPIREKYVFDAASEKKEPKIFSLRIDTFSHRTRAHAVIDQLRTSGELMDEKLWYDIRADIMNEKGRLVKATADGQLVALLYVKNEADGERNGDYLSIQAVHVREEWHTRQVLQHIVLYIAERFAQGSDIYFDVPSKGRQTFLHNEKYSHEFSALIKEGKGQAPQHAMPLCLRSNELDTLRRYDKEEQSILQNEFKRQSTQENIHDDSEQMSPSFNINLVSVLERYREREDVEDAKVKTAVPWKTIGSVIGVLAAGCATIGFGLYVNLLSLSLNTMYTHFPTMILHGAFGGACGAVLMNFLNWAYENEYVPSDEAQHAALWYTLFPCALVSIPLLNILFGYYLHFDYVAAIFMGGIGGVAVSIGLAGVVARIIDYVIHPVGRMIQSIANHPRAQYLGKDAYNASDAAYNIGLLVSLPVFLTVGILVTNGNIGLYDLTFDDLEMLIIALGSGVVVGRFSGMFAQLVTDCIVKPVVNGIKNLSHDSIEKTLVEEEYQLETNMHTEIEEISEDDFPTSPLAIHGQKSPFLRYFILVASIFIILFIMLNAVFKLDSSQFRDYVFKSTSSSSHRTLPEGQPERSAEQESDQKTAVADSLEDTQKKPYSLGVDTNLDEAGKVSPLPEAEENELSFELVNPENVTGTELVVIVYNGQGNYEYREQSKDKIPEDVLKKILQLVENIIGKLKSDSKDHRVVVRVMKDTNKEIQKPGIAISGDTTTVYIDFDMVNDSSQEVPSDELAGNVHRDIHRSQRGIVTFLSAGLCLVPSLVYAAGEAVANESILSVLMSGALFTFLIGGLALIMYRILPRVWNSLKKNFVQKGYERVETIFAKNEGISTVWFIGGGALIFVLFLLANYMVYFEKYPTLSHYAKPTGVPLVYQTYNDHTIPGGFDIVSKLRKDIKPIKKHLIAIETIAAQHDVDWLVRVREIEQYLRKNRLISDKALATDTHGNGVCDVALGLFRGYTLYNADREEGVSDWEAAVNEMLGHERVTSPVDKTISGNQNGFSAIQAIGILALACILITCAPLVVMSGAAAALLVRVYVLHKQGKLKEPLQKFGTDVIDYLAVKIPPLIDRMSDAYASGQAFIEKIQGATFYRSVTQKKAQGLQFFNRRVMKPIGRGLFVCAQYGISVITTIYHFIARYGSSFAQRVGKNRLYQETIGDILRSLQLVYHFIVVPILIPISYLLSLIIYPIVLAFGATGKFPRIAKAVTTVVLIVIAPVFVFANERFVTPQTLGQQPAGIALAQKGATDVSAMRDILNRSYNYFRYGTGIDEKTELPYERLAVSKNSITNQDTRTQPTLIGFYVQFLIDIAHGNIKVDFIKPLDAQKRLERILDTILDIQKRYGWKGLLPTWGEIHDGRYTTVGNAYATGDNLNLAVKVFMVLGAFEENTVLYTKAKQFLDAQQSGYVAMYDAQKNLFYGARKNGKINPTYYLDRISNEFAPGVAWAVTYYGMSTDAFYNLGAPIDSTNNTLLSWNGDGFTMGWQLLTFDTTQFKAFNIAQYNYLHTMLRISHADGQPGLRSPSDDPFGGYAISGYNALREGGNIVENVWSPYALGVYYRLPAARHTLNKWLENLARSVMMVGPLGLFDAGRGTVYTTIKTTNTILGIDHISFLLGLGTEGPRYFERAFERLGSLSKHKAMYQAYADQNLSSLVLLTSPLAHPPQASEKIAPSTDTSQKKSNNFSSQTLIFDLLAHFNLSPYTNWGKAIVTKDGNALLIKHNRRADGGGHSWAGENLTMPCRIGKGQRIVVKGAGSFTLKLEGSRTVLFKVDLDTNGQTVLHIPAGIVIQRIIIDHIQPGTSVRIEQMGIIGGEGKETSSVDDVLWQGMKNAFSRISLSGAVSLGAATVFAADMIPAVLGERAIAALAKSLAQENDSTAREEIINALVAFGKENQDALHAILGALNRKENTDREYAKVSWALGKIAGKKSASDIIQAVDPIVRAFGIFCALPYIEALLKTGVRTSEIETFLRTIMTAEDIERVPSDTYILKTMIQKNGWPVIKELDEVAQRLGERALLSDKGYREVLAKDVFEYDLRIFIYRLGESMGRILTNLQVNDLVGYIQERKEAVPFDEVKVQIDLTGLDTHGRSMGERIPLTGPVLGKRAIAALAKSLAQENDSTAREEIINALVSFGKENQDAVHAILRALNRRENTVREYAKVSWALGEIAGKESVSDIIKEVNPLLLNSGIFFSLPYLNALLKTGVRTSEIETLLRTVMTDTNIEKNIFDTYILKTLIQKNGWPIIKELNNVPQRVGEQAPLTEFGYNNVLKNDEYGFELPIFLYRLSESMNRILTNIQVNTLVTRIYPQSSDTPMSFKDIQEHIDITGLDVRGRSIVNRVQLTDEGLKMVILSTDAVEIEKFIRHYVERESIDTSQAEIQRLSRNLADRKMIIFTIQGLEEILKKTAGKKTSHTGENVIPLTKTLPAIFINGLVGLFCSTVLASDMRPQQKTESLFEIFQDWEAALERECDMNESAHFGSVSSSRLILNSRENQKVIDALNALYHSKETVHPDELEQEISLIKDVLTGQVKVSKKLRVYAAFQAYYMISKHNALYGSDISPIGLLRPYAQNVFINTVDRASDHPSEEEVFAAALIYKAKFELPVVIDLAMDVLYSAAFNDRHTHQQFARAVLELSADNQISYDPEKLYELEYKDVVALAIGIIDDNGYRHYTDVILKRVMTEWRINGRFHTLEELEKSVRSACDDLGKQPAKKKTEKKKTQNAPFTKVSPGKQKIAKNLKHETMKKSALLNRSPVAKNYAQRGNMPIRLITDFNQGKYRITPKDPTTLTQLGFFKIKDGASQEVTSYVIDEGPQQNVFLRIKTLLDEALEIEHRVREKLGYLLNKEVKIIIVEDMGEIVNVFPREENVIYVDSDIAHKSFSSVDLWWYLRHEARAHKTDNGRITYETEAAPVWGSIIDLFLLKEKGFGNLHNTIEASLLYNPLITNWQEWNRIFSEVELLLFRKKLNFATFDIDQAASSTYITQFIKKQNVPDLIYELIVTFLIERNKRDSLDDILKENKEVAEPLMKAYFEFLSGFPHEIGYDHVLRNMFTGDDPGVVIIPESFYAAFNQLFVHYEETRNLFKRTKNKKIEVVADADVMRVIERNMKNGNGDHITVMATVDHDIIQKIKTEGGMWRTVNTITFDNNMSDFGKFTLSELANWYLAAMLYSIYRGKIPPHIAFNKLLENNGVISDTAVTDYLKINEYLSETLMKQLYEQHRRRAIEIAA